MAAAHRSQRAAPRRDVEQFDRVLPQSGVHGYPRIGASRAVSGGSWQPYASTYVGAGITQEAFDFGRIAAQAAAADALVDVQRQLAANALLDVTYSVEESYFAMYAAKAVLQASEDAYTRAKAHRDLAKSGVDSGMRSPIELTRADADFARFDAGRIQARGGLATARAVYAASVGVPDASLDVAGTPSTPPDIPVLSDAIAQAGRRDPRILAAIAQLRAQESKTTAIRSETRPNLFLTGTILAARRRSDPLLGRPRNRQRLGAQHSELGRRRRYLLAALRSIVRAGAETSRAEEESRRQELNQARFQEVASIRTAYVGVVVAREALPALQQSVTAARANWAQADARFHAGLATAVELADAEALLADAEINLALGIFEVARTRAILEEDRRGSLNGNDLPHPPRRESAELHPPVHRARQGHYSAGHRGGVVAILVAGFFLILHAESKTNKVALASAPQPVTVVAAQGDALPPVAHVRRTPRAVDGGERRAAVHLRRTSTRCSCAPARS